MTRTALLVVAAVLTSSGMAASAALGEDHKRHQPARVIGTTLIIGDVNPALWTIVLDILPVRPARIVVLDTQSLSIAAREKVRGLDAFILDGNSTVFVLRQAATLCQAEFGDAFDRLVLASLVFHEMSHARGLDEHAALAAEQELWRGFVAAGRADPAPGNAYLQKLEEQKRKLEAAPWPKR